MTDEIDNSPEDIIPSDPETNNRQSRIDALVNFAGSRFNTISPMPVTVAAPRENWRYESHTDTMLNLDTHTRYAADDLAAMQAEQNAGARISDDGRDLDYSLQQMATEIDRLKSKLDEGAFDPKTGKKVFHLQGQLRYAHEVNLKQLQASIQDQARINARIQLQRDADRFAREQAVIDEAAIEEVIRTETQRRLLELEVEERAKAAFAAKRNKERSGY